MLSRSKAAKPRKFIVTNMQEKLVDFFCGIARASILAPEIILQT